MSPYSTTFRAFIQKHFICIVILLSLSIGIYLNSLAGTFAVVDDLQGYIENPAIKDLPGSLKTLNLHTIWYAVVYHFYGINPLPMRIMAISAHAITTILAYVIITKLFNKKIAFIAALIFAVHPVNTEAIDWISAQFYIIMTIFLYSAILSHILYRQTKKVMYLYFTAAIFLLYLILLRNPWILIIPISLSVIDYFILGHTFDTKIYKKYALIFLPIIAAYLIFVFPQAYHNRTAGESIQNGKILVNEQALIPILEGYPYSLYSMVQLYVLPIGLSVYYDGNVVTAGTKILMYLVSMIYVAAIIYFYKRDKRISGLLIILPVFVAPVFSPIKVTWYITERYLYLGTAFFTTLVAITLLYLEKKTKITYFAYGMTAVIVIIFGLRTYIRNNDWRNPETLAYATMKTAPLSVRPYNDLAGYLARNNRLSEAKQLYAKTVKMGASIVAMNNLGYLYINGDLDPNIKTLQQPIDEILNLAYQALNKKEIRLAMFYFNEAYGLNQKDVRVLNGVSLIYLTTAKLDKAAKYLTISNTLVDKNPDTHYLLGFLAFKKGDMKEAEKQLTIVLTIDPNHAGAKANIEDVRKALSQ